MIGIIILNYNTWRDVIKCINSIKEKVKNTNYSIYIIDNASTDDSLEQLRKCYKNDNKIKIDISPYNHGYSSGNNIGIKLAIKDGAEKILVLNPDVIFLNDVLSILENHLEENKDVGIIGPCIYDSLGNKTAIIRKNYDFKYSFFERRPINLVLKLFKKLDINYSYSLDKTWKFEGMVSGCCFMIDSKLFLKLGLFDENVFLYAEEYILGLKLKDNNLLTMYDSDAQILHNHGSSTKSRGKAFVNYHRYRSAFYTLLKYCNCKDWQYGLIFLQIKLLFFFRSLYLNDYKKQLRAFNNDINKLKNEFI